MSLIGAVLIVLSFGHPAFPNNVLSTPRACVGCLRPLPRSAVFVNSLNVPLGSNSATAPFGCFRCSHALTSSSASLSSRISSEAAISVPEPNMLLLMLFASLGIVLTLARQSGNPDQTFFSSAPQDKVSIQGVAERGATSFPMGKAAGANTLTFSDLEKHIIRMAMLGLSDTSISAVLHFPPGKVKQHMRRMIGITGAGSRMDLIVRLSNDPHFLDWVRFLRESSRARMLGTESVVAPMGPNA